MTRESALALTVKCRRVVFVLLTLAAAAVCTATFLRIDHGIVAVASPVTRSLVSLPEDASDPQVVLAVMAGRRLIKSPEVQAAVKDRGAAKKMLEELDLHGVVHVKGELTAYIRVQGGDVKSVRVGDTIQEFRVEKILPGRVVLTFEGVVVELQH